jgi:hypothetical protein
MKKAAEDRSLPMFRYGRAIAQAASHRGGGPGSKPGLAMWDFVMDKSGAGAGFLSENFGFPCTIYIPSASPQSS